MVNSRTFDDFRRISPATPGDGDVPSGTIAAADLIKFKDVDDGNIEKEDQIQGILDLISGGGWEFVEAVPASGSSSVVLGEGNILVGYDHQIRCLNIDVSTALSAANGPRLQYGTGGTPTYQTTGYENGSLVGNNASTVVTSNSFSNGVGILQYGNISGTAGDTYDATITISDPGTSRKHKAFVHGCFESDSAGIIANFISGGVRTTAEAITGFKILQGTGTFTGDFVLYRRKLTA